MTRVAADKLDAAGQRAYLASRNDADWSGMTPRQRNHWRRVAAAVLDVDVTEHLEPVDDGLGP